MSATYNLRDQAVISASPDRVWDALLAELGGARQWWAEKNTFTPTHLMPWEVGALTQMAVRPNGAGKPGPVLQFTARTRQAVPNELLAMDYISGVFSGTGVFRLRPDGENRTILTMDFAASPQGWLKALARVKDIGAEHSAGTLAAFQALNRLFSGGKDGTLGVQPQFRSWEGTVESDDGARLAVADRWPDAGDGIALPSRAAVVLVHGWGGSKEAWDEVSTGLLSAGHRVLTLDLRGHGASTRGDAELTLHRLADDLTEVLESRDVRDVFLVGQSGGGLAALLFAARAEPSVEVQGLALLAAAVHGQEVSVPELVLMGSGMFSRILRVPALAEKILAATMGPRAAFTGRKAVARSLAAVEPTVRREFFGLIRGVDLRAEASQLTLPVVLMVGTEDRVVPPPVLRGTASSFLRPRFIEVPDRGHMLHVEAPGVVVEAIVKMAGERPANAVASVYGSE